MLQLKPGKAVETLGRFAINSTIGVAGLIDVAKRNRFAFPVTPTALLTLGYYGVKPPPFLFLPLIGPTTVRDLFGRWVDLLVLSNAVGKPFTDPIYGATTPVSARSMNALKLMTGCQLKDGSQDHYKALRDDYLRNRQAEIDQLHAKKGMPAALNLLRQLIQRRPLRMRPLRPRGSNKASITYCPRTSLAAVG